MASISDSYKYLIDLTTNGVVITDAIKYVWTNRTPKRSREKTCRISDKDTETEAEQVGPELEEKTHSEIFSRRAKTI